MCLEKMKKVLHALVNANRVRGGASACDDVLSLFDEFISATVATLPLLLLTLMKLMQELMNYCISSWLTISITGQCGGW